MKKASEKEIKIKRIPKKKTIYLAGGCFWGVQEYFRRLNGVISTEVGYANGRTEETSYRLLADTGHAETVKVEYDANTIALRELILHFFRIIDPKSLNKQGNDVGTQYRTGIYYVEAADLDDINVVMEYEKSLHGELAVEVQELKNYVVAEKDHQDYLRKIPNGYCHINPDLAYNSLFSFAREVLEPDKFIELLGREDGYIMVNAGTERPFSSPLNDEERRGVYVDRMTGDVLFLSRDKFDSGSGWPSFTRPFEDGRLKLVIDDSFGMNRIEVKSRRSNLHLGHVFDDGPRDRGGLRYCMNGACLDFIPYEELDQPGYDYYKILV